MMTPSPQELTQLLVDWCSGDQAALCELRPPVYDELHRIEHGYIGEDGRDE